LSLFHLHVSPLRERREEIPLLVGHFMIRLVQRYGVPAPRFTNVLIEACQRHAWPGNLRELENFVKRFLALGDEQAALEEIRIHQSLEVIERRMNGLGNGVEAKVTQGTGEKSSLKMVARNAKGEAERHAIAHALEETRWNRKAAARLLNISYRGLLYKIQEYHMSPPADDASSAREPILRQAT
jgi:two-component system, NtrC family, response regulator AtoC